MVVFYTFDRPNFSDKLNHNYFTYIDTLLMLKISIYSVIRELKESLTTICIYSNDIDIIKTDLNIENSLILFRKIPSEIGELIEGARMNDPYFDNNPNEFNTSHFKMINGKYGTAHARVFIFSELLTEFKKDVLYLDYDTGIKRGSGKELLEKINLGVVISDMKTADSIAYDILRMFPAFKLEGVPDCIEIKAPRWSCGYLFLPCNSLSKRMATAFKNKYIDLINELGFMESHDENAICLTLFDNSITPLLLFENTSWYKVRSPEFQHRNLGCAPSIVHYSYQKGHSKYKLQLLNWLKHWKESFDNKLPDPKFDQLNYLQMSSFDFIWGRFETI